MFLLPRLILTPRNLLPLVALAVCLWLLSHRLDAVDLPRVWQAVADLSPLQWALGGLATISSLAAVGQYDVVIHRALGTGIVPKAARRGGIVAIALSQTIGFGMISGALVRWRMLPELSLWRATKLTAIVATSFMGALAAFGALVIWVLRPGFLSFEGTLSATVLLTLATVLVLGMKGVKIGRVALRSPNILVIGSLLGWVALDTVLAALALYWLLPAGTDVSFFLLFPAFLIALAVGMISGSPAGLGAFELTLLALIPSSVMAECLAATLAFRLIYYAVPAVLALGPLALADRFSPRNIQPFSVRRAQAGLRTGPNTEAAVLRQDDGLVLSGPRARWGIRATQHALVALGQPLSGTPRAALPLLSAAATSTARLPALYKVPARTAAQSRSLGWAATRVAHEAVLDPQTFTTGGSARRQLRRALRKAEEAGIKTSLARGSLPGADMTKIHTEWRMRNGPERGFSMGRFDLTYLRGQRVYLAYDDKALVGFVSFHANAREWVLDLMRQSDDAASGTMHALIHHALKDAKQAGLHRLSLAAVPDDSKAQNTLERFIRTHVQSASGASGLRRFKASFAPRWEPRYLVTRRKWHAALAAFEIAQAIKNPRRGPTEQLLNANDANLPHNHYENYEIDSYSRACQTSR